MTLKGLLALGGALAGAGGVVSVAHNTPTILWKSGATCQPLDIETDKEEELKNKIYYKWKDGSGYSARPKGYGKKTNNPDCYKR